MAEECYTFDNTSEFLPKAEKRVKLKVTKVTYDLPFSGDSQILYDDCTQGR